MNIINKKLSLEEFKDYVRTFNFGRFVANKLVIHHTWRPTKDQWKGESSIKGLKSYYERKRWNAGPHIFIAEDGIWLFTPMNVKGIHAGVGNWRSIGIEVVGDYDTKKWSEKTKEHALGAITVLMDKLDLNTEVVKFHRDFSNKSCPGYAITKEWLFREINYYRKKEEVPEWGEDAWEWAKKHGIISSQSKFEDPLTKGELIVILHRFNNTNAK